jgi:hypothetical protein
MKKAFRLAAMAFAVIGLMTACKQKAPEVEMDTTPVDTMTMEEVIDTIDTVAVAEAEPVKTAVKKATKKKEVSAAEKLAENAASGRSANGSMTLKKADGTTSTSKNDLNASDAKLQKNTQQSFGNVGRAAKQ